MCRNDTKRASISEDSNNVVPTVIVTPPHADQKIMFRSRRAAESSSSEDSGSDAGQRNPHAKTVKSHSFGGFGKLPGLNVQEEVSFAELRSLVEGPKKEPTKKTVSKIKEFAEKYKDFKGAGMGAQPWYRELVPQSQAAHVIVVLSVLWLAFCLSADPRRPPSQSPLMRFCYLASVAAVFGMEFWMTFVSGLALFFSVPRHVFAQVQVVLFPLYFLVKSVLLMLALFAYTHLAAHAWSAEHCLQGGLLALGALCNIAIRLYLSPPLVSLIKVKMAIEAEEGLGAGVGSSAPGRLAHCPHYMRLHRAFRRVHGLIGAGNVVSMAATALCVYNIAKQMC